ncbi:hypothetical protein PUN28_019414 [Cardiocondyla obscurior]|uniref:Uncharacterized protein n=1 Tax=Cardiocondyla obscurior TaxID=286306 RepID=A0AAW2EBD3_9HYME
MFIFIPTICMIIHVWGNMVLVIDSLHIIFPMMAVIMKYIIMRCKRTVFIEIVNMMAEDWMAFKHFTERDVMIRQARIARLIIIIGYILILIGFVTVIIPPYYGIQILYTTNLMNRTKLLPLETFYFYNTDMSPQYELTFFIHSITTLLAATIYMSIDIFLMLMIYHICGQLEIFRYRLISLILCQNFNKVLSNIITAHLRLVRYVYFKN